MKAKLILITVLALGALAHAQGFASHVSVGVGLQGIFPGATFKEDVVSNTNSTQSTTNSVGAVGSLRFDFGHHSALDISVTVNRNTERFVLNTLAGGGIPGRVQTNNAEIIGSFIFRLPANDFIKPYALLGGGVVRFSPNNDFTILGAVPQVDTKPAFAYGFGSDFPLGEHLALRLQYRGLVRSSPDFKVSALPFGTGLKTHVAEPSVQVVWHF